MENTSPEIKAGARNVAVVLTSAGKPETRGSVTLQEWTPRERSRRALKSLGICWAGAIVAVLIPMLHFVLVPGLLVAGPIVAWFTYQQERLVTGGEGSCPSCRKAFQIMKAKVQWPLSDLCPGCQAAILIDPAS